MKSYLESILEHLITKPKELAPFSIWEYIFYEYLFIFIIPLILAPILLAVLKKSFKPIYFLLINIASFIIPLFIAMWNVTSGRAYHIVLFYFVISSINLIAVIFVFLRNARESRDLTQ